MCLYYISLIPNKYVLLLSLALLSFNLDTASAQTVSLKGTTVDLRTAQPIPYVSIGIKNKAIGTVSDSTGRYTLSYLPFELSATDSIFFSAVGYQNIKIDWQQFLKAEKTIKIEEREEMLQTVDVKAKAGKLKSYGRSSASLIFFPSMYKKIPRQSDEKGREQATILKINQNIVLRKLSFLINRRTFRHIKLRMNIYQVKDGLPDVSVLKKDVVFDVAGNSTAGMPRAQVIDLKPYQIHLQGLKEIAVSLAVLDLKPLEGDTAGPAFFIPSFPGPLRSSFFRMKSEASWQKVSSSNLMISLEASSLKADGNAAEEDDNVANDDEITRNDKGSLMKGDDKGMEEPGERGTDLMQQDTSLLALLYGNNHGKRINIDKGQLYYERYGQGEPLILLHGNNESINSFRKQIAVFSAHFQVIAVDTRGQGNSLNNDTLAYKYEQFASDLLFLMDKLAIKKANLLGWSDGGNTALIFALQHPDRVEKIIVMGANLFPGREAIKEEVIQLFETRRDSLMKHQDRVSKNQLRLTELVLKEPHINPESLHSISAPVLVLAGEQDVILEKHTRLIHAHLKNSTLTIIPGADHYAPLKAYKVFNQLVLDFLKPEKGGK